MLYFPHDTFDKRRLTLAVLADERHLVSALNRQIGALEHHLLSIRFPNILHDDRITARTGGRRKFQTQSGSVLFVHLQQFQFLQHFHTALYLQGLRVRPLETFDELLRLGDELLLLIVRLLLLFAAFLAQLEVL